MNSTAWIAVVGVLAPLKPLLRRLTEAQAVMPANSHPC